MKSEVEQILSRALDAWKTAQTPAFPGGSAAVSVEIPPSNIPGDLASNLPMALAKQLKKAPRAVAQDLIAQLPEQSVIEKVEIAGPGFLNIFLRSSWLVEELRAILKKRQAYARQIPAGQSKVLLEFVSANPNGPLHVGHGRGAALGDSLARILRHLGHEVSTEYYVNNMGNQMENLGASVLWRCLEIRPDYADPEEKALLDSKKPEDLYKGEYIKDIARDVLAEFPDPAKRPRGIQFFKEKGISHMLRVIGDDLKRFNVRMDNWFLESQLHAGGAVDKALDALRQNGYLKEEEGALWFLSTKFGDDKDRVIKRADERPTYFAADIAYHAQKYDRGFQWMIDVWGTDHHGYVQRIKAVVQALGRDPDSLTILLYQLVTLLRDGKPVAMSTRTGEFVTLQEVVEEVGTDAARFFFAMRGPNSHLEFDLDLAKRHAPENPVFYVQYVHARCCSLFREADKRGIAVGNLDGFSMPARLEPAERALLIKLASYPDAIRQCGQDLSPHHLTAYLMSLAGEYHRFYENCQVLDQPAEITAFRLALVDAVRTLIAGGLDLLGVSSPQEM